MEGDETAAALHLFGELGEAFFLDGGVKRVAVGVDQNGVSTGDDVIGWPLAIQVRLHLDEVAGAFAEALGEE